MKNPRNLLDFGGFCFLECPGLDFDDGREYIREVTILITACYGSGLRKGTHSVFELVDIKMVVTGELPIADHAWKRGRQS